MNALVELLPTTGASDLSRSSPGKETASERGKEAFSPRSTNGDAARELSKSTFDLYCPESIAICWDDCELCLEVPNKAENSFPLHKAKIARVKIDSGSSTKSISPHLRPLVLSKDEAYGMLSSAKPILPSDSSHLDAKLRTKTWIQLIVRAVEEDLARKAVKCGNKYCTQVKQRGEKVRGCDKREVGGRKEWLCNACVAAYDRKQFCEFCSQIYLENTGEASALDGKEWAQCEGPEECGRWAHVECLGKRYRKSRDEVVAATFKYLCCGCNEKASGKRGSKANR